MEFISALTRRSLLPIIATDNLRVAHLDSISGFVGARPFPPERWGALEAFAPNVLTGSVAQLGRLMERMNLRTVNAGSVDHSVFVVTQLGDIPLTPRFRDRLWRQFGAPIYEVYVDEQGRLLAFECEAQHGWHVQPGIQFLSAYGELLVERGSQALRTGLNWITEETPCACGREGVRLLHPGRSLNMESPVALSA